VFRFWTMDEALAAIFDGRTPLERVEEWVSVDEGARGTRWVNVVGRRSACSPATRSAGRTDSAWPCGQGKVHFTLDPR
jgi:hypothetical protein